jgi:hypothetical protein
VASFIDSPDRWKAAARGKKISFRISPATAIPAETSSDTSVPVMAVRMGRPFLERLSDRGADPAVFFGDDRDVDQEHPDPPEL